MSLYTILVPCKMNTGRPIRTRQHRVWDAKVKALTGGLTILPPAKGQWVSPTGQEFIERMIPVNIQATEDQMKEIVAMTAKFYEQEAIMWWMVTPHVHVDHFPEYRSNNEDQG